MSQLEYERRNLLVKWRRKDYEGIPKRMREQQRALTDVCGDPDIPNYGSWVVYARKHPELREKVRRIVFTFPYSAQIKTRDVSPNLQKDCERLRASGMTTENIAKALGIPRNSVFRVLRGFDEKMGLGKYEWGREDFETILDRVRWQQRHRMSYPFQASVRCISPRFRIDCERLRAGGMSIERISKALGLSQAPVRRALRGFDEKMGLWNNKWRREKFETILDRIREQQRPLQDVCGDPDLPTKGDWVSYAKKHPEFITKLKEVYHNMSYPFQARVRNLSPRFRIDCERLYAAGMSISKIVKILGVSYSSVRNVL